MSSVGKIDSALNIPISVTLSNGNTYGMYSLSIEGIRAIDNWCASRFFDDVARKIEGMTDPKSRNEMMTHAILISHDITASSEYGTRYASTPEGVCFRRFQQVKRDYHGDFNLWKAEFFGQNDADLSENITRTYRVDALLIERDAKVNIIESISEQQSNDNLVRAIHTAVTELNMTFDEVQECTYSQLNFLFSDPEKAKKTFASFKEAKMALYAMRGK